MDSTDKPTVSYTFEDVGITPTYLKTALEDLANDQIRMEDDIAGTRRTVMVVGGTTMFTLFGLLLLIRMQQKLAGALQQVAGSLLATQEHVGMFRPVNSAEVAPDPIPQPPIQDKKVDRDWTEANTVVDIGSGYDPGPQDIPAHVREAVESEPVNDMLDEPGV